MWRVRGKKPSPATVISIVSLLFAVTGTAVAGVATVSVLNKKEKKQTRKIARDEIKKAAPGLSVANAVSAQSASTVQNGSIGTEKFAPSIPAARVTRTVDQSIANATATPLAFNSERYDTAAMHDDTTDNSRLTAPVTGIYAVTAQVRWALDVDGIRELSLVKNDNTILAGDSAVPTPVPFSQEVTTQVRLQAGEFVEAVVEQESGGGSLEVLKDDETSPEFSMTWLAPGP
jgi:hypothetical protein